MPGRTAEELAAAFHDAAAQARVGSAFIGGVAVNTWGKPRSSQGVDCLVDLSPQQDAAFLAALAAQSLTAAMHDLAAARRERSHVTIFDRLGDFHLDCKLAAKPAERREVAEAASVPLRSRVVRVVRAEEAIAYKVLFGSPRDLEDAKSIVQRQGAKLDQTRLAAFAVELGVSRQVQDLLRQAGP